MTVLLAACALALAAAPDDRYESYLAHIAAAQGAMARYDAAGARRWLDAAPLEYRGWEWRHLNAAADQSRATWPAEGVFRLSVSGDGTRVITAGTDGTAQVRDAVTGALLVTLRGHEQGVLDAALGPAGTRAATASRDGTLRLWDTATGAEIATLWHHDHPVSSVAFSPDDRRLAASSYVRVGQSVEGTVRILDAGTGEQIMTLEAGDKPVSMVTYSADGRRLAASSWGFKVFVWDAETGEPISVLEVPADERYAAVDCVAFSPDGTLVAAGSKDWAVRIWPVDGGQPLVLADHGGWVSGLGFSPDGALLASGSYDATVRLWDPLDGRCVAVLRGHRGAVTTVAFAADGTLLSGSRDGTIKQWSAETRGRDLAHPPNGAYAVAFSPDGRLLASAGDDSVILWDPVTDRALANLIGHNDAVVAVAFSPNGTKLATGSHDLTVRLWDADTGEELYTLFPQTSTVEAVAFSHDGRVLVSGGGGRITLWETDAGAAMPAPRSEGRGLVAGGLGGTDGPLAWSVVEGRVQLWATLSGRDVVSLDTGPPGGVSISADGRLLATGDGEGDIVLWEVSTGAPLFRLAGHDAMVRSLAFSPDGARLATGGRDNSVRLWDVTTGVNVATVRGYHEWVYAVAFSPDGSLLAACPLDGTIDLLDTVALPWRLDERREGLALEARVAPTVERLLHDGMQPRAVAAAVRADRELSEAGRRAALNVLLRVVNGQ